MAILSLYVLYVAAINVVLSTPLFGRIVNGTPDKMFVAYERAWSIWPGTVHTRKLVIRASDNQVEWLLRLDSCSFDLALLGLAHKAVHFDRARGKGGVFQLRQRVEAPAATPEYVDALAPIPGFPRIPLKTQTPPDLLERWDDRHYHLWSVELSDAVVDDVRQIWIDTVKTEGTARITGGFLVKPIRKAWVGPAHAEARDLRVTVMDQLVAESVTGTFDVGIDTFDPRTVKGVDLLKRLSVTTELRGRLPELAHLPGSLRGPLVLSGPVEVPRLAVHLEKGTIEKGTHVDVVATGVRAEAAGHRGAGNLVFAADAADAPGPTSVAFRIEGRSLSVGRVGQDGDVTSIVRVAALDLAGALDAPMLDLTDPQVALRGEVQVPDVELVDRKLLARYLPAGKAPEVAQGHEHFDAHGTFTMVDQTAAGSIDVHARDLGLVLSPVLLTTDIRAHLGVHDWATDEGRMAVDEASVTLTGTELRRTGTAAAALSIARAAVQAKSEALTLSDPLARIDLDGAIEGGKLLDSSVLDTFLANASDVTVDATRGAGRFVAAVHAEVDRHVARGSASAHTHAVGVRTPRLRVRGELDANAVVSAWSLDESRMRGVSATVRVDDVAAELGQTRRGTSAPARAADVRSRRVELRAKAADVKLSPASLRNVDYRVVIVDAEMDDAAKLGALLSGGPNAPDAPDEKGVAIESGRARGSADVSVSPSRRSASGGVKLVVAGAGVRVRKTHVRGNVDVDLRVAGLLPGSGHGIDIAGSHVALRNVETAGAAAHAKAWNGDLALVRGVLQVSDTPGLDSITQLTADDASPILALTIQDHLPKFVVDPLEAPGLAAQAHIVIEGGRAAILDGRMQGGNVVVAGDYVSRAGHVRGAFTAAKGAVSAGVKLDDGGASVVLGGLDAWRARERGVVLALFMASEPAPAATAAASARPTPSPAPLDSSKAKFSPPAR